MKRIFISTILILTTIGFMSAQKNKSQTTELNRPKLVVGIVVD